MTSESHSHQEYMRMALALASQGLYTTDPNPRVGCVLVKDGLVVGKGFHAKAGEPHAEVYALQQAGYAARGATAYVTLEPCSHHGRTPPCADALIKAGVTQVFVAQTDPNPQVLGGGVQGLRDAGIEVETGLLADEAKALNPGFYQRMMTGMPWVTGKLAISMDGAVSLRNGQSQWITGPAAREDAHKLRARSSVIVSGIGTLLADDARYNARLDGVDIQQPLVVLLDSQGRLPETAAVFTTGVPGIQVVAEGARQISLPDHWQRWTLPREARGIALRPLLQRLGELECNEVMVEAGPAVLSSFFDQDLFDQLVVYQAPVWLGQGANPAFQMGPFDAMVDTTRFDVIRHESLGDDIKWIMQPRREGV